MVSEQFDYDAPSVPDSAVADVAAAIRSQGRLPPLSDAERELRRLEREAYRWECDQRREQRRINQRIKEEALEAEQEAIAREQAQIEQAEANRQARLRREAEISRQAHQREMADLRFQSAQNRAWQDSVTSSFRQTLAHQQRQATIAEIDAIINPPPPAPEMEEPPKDQQEFPPNPKIGDPDFWEKWTARRPLRSWW